MALSAEDLERAARRSIGEPKHNPVPWETEGGQKGFIPSDVALVLTLTKTNELLERLLEKGSDATSKP